MRPTPKEWTANSCFSTQTIMDCFAVQRVAHNPEVLSSIFSGHIYGRLKNRELTQSVEWKSIQQLNPSVRRGREGEGEGEGGRGRERQREDREDREDRKRERERERELGPSHEWGATTSCSNKATPILAQTWLPPCRLQTTELNGNAPAASRTRVTSRYVPLHYKCLWCTVS